MSPVDLCKQEGCESGCTNILVTKNTPVIVNTNSTSLVGVDSYITAKCVCKNAMYGPNYTESCDTIRCLNGGTCLDVPSSDGQRSVLELFGTSFTKLGTVTKCQQLSLNE